MEAKIRRFGVKSWGLALGAALLCAYALGLLYEGFLAPRYLGVLSYPFVDRPAAQRAYGRIAADAPPPAVLQAAAQRLVRADPADPKSWNAVAYADWTAHGHLTAEGVEALGRSYAVSFFDYRGAVWRVDFALQNWAQLTPQIRQEALTEGDIALRNAVLAPRLRARLQTLRSPEGRLAAMMLLGGALRAPAR